MRTALRVWAAPCARVVVPGAVLLLTASEAEASGFGTARFGGEHGHPTTDNPTALYYNPAGIAEDTPGFEKKFWRVKIFADANLALRWASWSHANNPDSDIPEPEGASGANTGEATLFNAVAAPAAAATMQIENFAFGIGFFVPLGGSSSWSKNPDFEGSSEFPGPVDGVQRWHTIDGTIRSLYFTVGAAYDILDRVSIGATLNIIRSEVFTVRAREVSGTNNIETEGRSLIDVGGWNASFGIGVIGEIAPEKVWVGFSYQAQPGMGQMDMEGTLTNKLTTGEPSTERVRLLQELPDIYRLGVRARPVKDVEIRVFGDMTNWSTFKNQCIVPETVVDPESGEEIANEQCDVEEDGSPTPGSLGPPIINIQRDWGPAFGLRAGGSYWVIPAVEVFVGAGYDSNAVPDRTLEPALTDFQKASVAGGARFQFGEIFGADVSYTHIFYVPRDTTGQSEFPDFENPTKSPDSGGRYTQTIGVINVNAMASF
ncbi:MAG: hypothetical protein HOW73_36595 [Polyangiaceae bacterium]|nr:hypothetical protein [Polyangiaceae bacterium]